MILSTDELFVKISATINRGIAQAIISEDGHLIFIMSDGEQIDLGDIQGPVLEALKAYVDQNQVLVDETLTEKGQAADAFVVGDAFRETKQDISDRLPKSGGTMTGPLDMGGNSITGADSVQAAALAVTPVGSDPDAGGYLAAGNSELGDGGIPVRIMELYGNAGDEPVVLRHLGTPRQDSDAANKAYVDAVAGSAGADGGYYTPAVDDSGNLTWTASKSDMPAVDGANIKGPKGDTGDTGPQGPQGPQGETGASGRGITSIDRTSGTGAAGTKDTYTITFTDNTKTTFQVYNGADGDSGSGSGAVSSVNGATGAVEIATCGVAICDTAGSTQQKSAKLLTESFALVNGCTVRVVFENANTVDEPSLVVTATDGSSLGGVIVMAKTMHPPSAADIGARMHTFVNFHGIWVLQDPVGSGEEDGVGIQSVEQTTTSTEDGGTNVVTVTKTDGTSSTFSVKNGSKGSPGSDGKSAYQYAQDGGYTRTEEEFAEKLAEEIPAVDATLTQGGQAADAKATGDSIRALSEEIANKAANVYIGPVQPTDGTLYWLDTSDSGGSGGETVTHTVTSALTNVTIDNTAASVNDGASFAATLTPFDGYTLSSATVTMGGNDITASAYASGNIYIASVTGDIVITAVAVAVSEGTTTYTITNNLVNVTSNNSAVSAEENSAYTATLTAADGYTLDGATVTVTMGGTDVTADVYADGVINIPAVTGDVAITAIGAEYLGESVSISYNSNLKGFSAYYSDDGTTLMEKTPRDRGGYASKVFESDMKITASLTIADYQNACYGYGLSAILGDSESRFYGGVYCGSGTHNVEIIVPAGNRVLIAGTYESHCKINSIYAKEV